MGDEMDCGDRTAKLDEMVRGIAFRCDLLTLNASLVNAGAADSEALARTASLVRDVARRGAAAVDTARPGDRERTF